ncbi:restriction endonuclease subunit S [Prevotella histicola]|jgi:type I restriction modification DNA specificity domain protein|uniref:restriction endonuclease subunit S n=1 Tax=Prevotella histicola TaxID=470565 RepID=UPI001CB497E3|nr:restriction endonuclease subunit S [Prevotella histicola]MBF1401120.1 restriction endonuclease subunit S [Prevotella histicola]
MEVRIGDSIECNPTVKLVKGNEYPLIDIDKITVGRKLVTNKDTIVYEKQSGCKFQNGDTLMARITPCLENGKMAMASIPDKGIGSTELFVFRGKKGITDNDFVYYFLKQSYIRNLAANSMTGASGRQRADLKFIKKIKFDLPSLPTQQKIATILSAYDRLIENNTRRIRLLEQMAENLYKEWFVRFRFPEHEKVEMVNGLPKGWETIHIKELAQLKSGYAFKSEWFVEEGEAVAKIKDIGNILMDTSSFSYVDKENCIKAKKFLLTTGDLTIALTGATIGKISIVPKHKGNIYTNQRLGKFFLGDKPMEKLPFLYCLFKQESMVSNIVNLSNSSSAQPNISPEQIEKIKILGNHDIISMYNKTCNPLFSNILALYSQNQLLTRQRDLLLPRLMSGKLEVKS